MKRLFLLALTVVLAAACSHSNQGYYLSYETVPVLKEPRPDADTVQLLSLMPTAKTHQADGLRHTSLFYMSRPTPVGVRKVDESGQWGYVRHRFPGVKGWIPLDRMRYCGNGKDVPGPVWTVRSDNTNLYKRPRALTKERLSYRLGKGDSVLVLEQVKGWSHVRRVQAGVPFRKQNFYGWVPTVRLQPTDSLKAR